MPAEPRSTRSLTETLEESSQAEGPTEKDESQKSQARTLEGNTAPHCEHVFVTDEFCAADASTPVRREHSENTMHLKCQARKKRILLRKRQQVCRSEAPRGASGIHLLSEHVAAEGDAAL